MKLATTGLVAIAALGVALAACSTVSTNPATATRPPSTSATSAPPASSPDPTPTVTITQQAQPAAPAPQPAQSPSTDQNVTDPWAVVSAYYGDIESGSYAQAWALLSSGAVTAQTYQQFVDGFACTGGQQLTEVGESGDQVSFNLSATDSCTGAVQTFSGTDTVQNGRIVAANVQQTS